ncbi:PEP-CTERM sorting domain-containing protein [Tundrisphaera sp. TA3]|uniref:PEP-CTERM sorting domain-containing protein n=1 Tax=Tundrisphaera sp. TA3 TaxID=3435775 RepID=UPI003EBD6B2A
MRRKSVPCFAPILVALLAGTASAEPIRYSTEHSLVPYLGFEGTTGTFEPGSSFSLGRFVIPVPDAKSPDSLDGVEFAIQLDAPDFARTIPPSGPDGIPTRVQSQVVIRGHFQGAPGNGTHPVSLSAVFDSVGFGGVLPLMLDARYQDSFPVSPADIKLPPPQLLMIPTDSWWVQNPPGSAIPYEQRPFYSGEIFVQVTPEPATLAAWGLVGIGALIARRRARVSGR